MTKLNRYAIPDSYILEELKQRYQNSDPKAQIALLIELYSTAILPYEIALLAVEDSSVEVRQWLARHGRSLDYSETRRVDDEWIYEHPERNLWQRLKKDPEPFVRACLRENEHFAFWRVEDEFTEATHLERLALMRNPEMRHADTLLKKIFDHEDSDLGIDEKERVELIVAFLTNEQVITLWEDEAGLSEKPKTQDGFSRIATLLTSLWVLASRWPRQTWAAIPSRVPGWVYEVLPVDDKTKAKVYQECDAPPLRGEILRGCSRQDLETLKLGVRDEDDDCRSEARSKVSQFDLYDVIETHPDEAESEDSKPGSILDKFRKWRGKNEELLASFIGGLAVLLFFFIYRKAAFEELLDFYSTPVGLIVFWFLVILLGLVGVGILGVLYNRYRWFHHVFCLGVIGLFQFVLESKVMAEVFFACYVVSLILPKVWEELSNELADKIIKKLEPVSGKKAP